MKDTEDKVKSYPGKKDKKKWCGGKKGKEHQYKWQRTKFTVGTSSEYVCQKCGRIADYCWRWGKSIGPCKCGLPHERH